MKLTDLDREHLSVWISELQGTADYAEKMVARHGSRGATMLRKRHANDLLTAELRIALLRKMMN